MKYIFRFVQFIILATFLYSCGGKEEKVSVLSEGDLDEQMITLFEEAYNAFLDDGDVLFAAQKFNEAELIFPQSEWAPIAALMSAYVYYSDDYYSDAIYELQRYIKVYPNHKNIDYANYLLAICYYEQIVDEKKDLNSIIEAKKNFEFVIKNFPNTEYALDAEFKLDLINDILAAKEMYVGRYYVDKKKWIAAINRFKFVIDNYDTTIYVEEAIHRLVEIYYILGLEDESKKYANLLGYNYQSSQWYENSYIVFNKNYKKNIIKKENSSILKRFKSLFN